MPETYILLEDRDRELALAAVKRAKTGMAVVIDHPKRSNVQNRRLWDMLHAIANSDLTFDGDRLDAEDWKDVLGSAWLKAKRREAGRVRKGLEGEPVVLSGFRSSKLNTKDFAEFSDSVLAFIDTHGIEWIERAKPPPPEHAR